MPAGLWLMHPSPEQRLGGEAELEEHQPSGHCWEAVNAPALGFNSLGSRLGLSLQPVLCLVKFHLSDVMRSLLNDLGLVLLRGPMVGDGWISLGHCLLAREASSALPHTLELLLFSPPWFRKLWSLPDAAPAPPQWLEEENLW